MESASLQFSDTRVEVDNYHHDFLILRSGDAGSLTRIGRAIYQRNFDFLEEVIVTEAEVLLKLGATYSPDQLPQLAEVEPTANAASRVFTLPVYFDGEWDWQAVEEHTGLDKESAINKLRLPLYPVAMLGFLPGFAYLSGLPGELHVPRKSVPDKYVEAGSVAIGGKYLGIYAIDSPGGWNVVGKTPLRLLQLPDLPPVPYLPGDWFRIHRIEIEEYRHLLAHPTTLGNY